VGKRAPANPDKFDEASAWFQSRTPVTKAEWNAMSSNARRQAFTIGGTQQLRVVQTTFDELAKAIANETSFEDFKSALKLKLKSQFTAKNSPALHTAFVTANQRAYNTGRYYQLNDPAVTARQPYQIYDAVLDAGTTIICSELSKTIRRHDDPWWLTHWPPMHFNCRSSVRALTPEDAKDRGGITPTLPRPVIPEDFGLAPPLVAGQVWEPDSNSYDPSAFREYMKKQRKLAANDNARKKAPKEHDPKHWEAQYRKQGFTHAAPTLAHGRAMEARGQAMTLQELSAGVAKLRSAGLIAETGGYDTRHTVDALLSGERKFANVAAAVKHLVSDADAAAADDITLAAALVQHVKAIETKTISLASVEAKGLSTAAEKTANAALEKTAAIYSAVADKSLNVADGYIFRAGEGRRAYHWGEARVIDMGAASGKASAEKLLESSLHEIGHAIEDRNGGALTRAKDLLATRTLGEVEVKMADLAPGAGYDQSEVTKPDKLYDPYMGKSYPNATEITSMVVQELHNNPKLLDLFTKDPESFRFVLGQLANK
jgi:hypothetical protein